MSCICDISKCAGYYLYFLPGVPFFHFSYTCPFWKILQKRAFDGILKPPDVLNKLLECSSPVASIKPPNHTSWIGSVIESPIPILGTAVCIIKL